MSTCTIVSTPASKHMNTGLSSPRPTNLQVAAARKLAAAFNHGWATDADGPTDAELCQLGLAAAGALWEARVAAAHGEEATRYLGLMPSFDEAGNIHHATGTGTVEWKVEPCGAVQLTVRATVNSPDGWGRKPGPVIYRALVVPSNPLTPGALVGGMIAPGLQWPEDGYAYDCAIGGLWALGFGPGSLEPWVAPLPRPALSAGPVRKL